MSGVHRGSVLRGGHTSDRLVLDEVVGLLTGTLGHALEAVILLGSAVRGGLRADSDLDVLAVTARRTTRSERVELLAGLLDRSRSAEHPDRRHLEVTIVVRSDIRPWRYPPPLELQYGDWWRAELAAGEEPWASPSADLAIVLTAARADGVALRGRPPRAVLPAIPREDLVHALRDVVPELLPGITEDDTRNSLLTLARVWLTLETGRIEPKDVAADWALERLPDGAGEALRLARDGYRGIAADRWDRAAVGQAMTDAALMVRAIDQGS